MNKKDLILAIGIAGGALALGLSATTIWNSKQMKLLRGTKMAEKILYKVGCVLQNIAE